jgi:hypothetical protein
MKNGGMAGKDVVVAAEIVRGASNAWAERRVSAGMKGWVTLRPVHHRNAPRYRGIVGPPLREPEAAMTIKSRTLRLPADQAEALEAIAGVDEVSVNEEIQRAIAAHIEARRSDPDFRQRLKASMERNREILERLAR